MRQPHGFIHPQYPNHICKLWKTIYRLLQAPRPKYIKLGSFFILINFVNSKFDTFLFLRQQKRYTIYLVYISNIIIIGNNFVKIK